MHRCKTIVRFVTFTSAVVAAILASTSVNLAVLREAPGPPEILTLNLDGDWFTLEEFDVGTLFDCFRGGRVGIVLKDSCGTIRWSYNLEDIAADLTIEKKRKDPVSCAMFGIPGQASLVWRNRRTTRRFGSSKYFTAELVA